MDSYRTKELAFLEESYKAQDSRLVILYGQRNIGKTRLLRVFMQEKKCLYYLAGEASERQQRILMARQFNACGIEVSEYAAYEEMTKAFAGSFSEKAVLVIDEFQFPLKSSPEFADAVFSLLQDPPAKGVLIILCSSSVSFVENQLVSRIGRRALSISAFLKVRELDFAHLRGAFPDYSLSDQIGLYAVLGGVPGYWRQFDASLSLKDNICQNLLRDGCLLLEESSRIVMEELREGGVYYAILSALADGKDKLGDIFEHTGFSRAKISVYLKNLMELELVSKVYSLDSAAHNMQRKGVYKISNHFVDFLFRFIYPNQSMLALLSPEEFYDRYIRSDFDTFCVNAYSSICHDYMEALALSGDLPFEVEDYGIFDGKEGYIDFVGIDEEGRFVSAFCCYDKPMMPYEFYENALRILSGAKVGQDAVYLFSREGFDEKITLQARVHDHLHLLTMGDFLS